MLANSSHILKVNLEIDSVISTYIDAKLNSVNGKTRISRLMSRAMGIQQHVRNRINQRAAGILVIAKLYIDSLVEQQSIEEVFDVLYR
jgi:hypothetical protein